MGTFVLIHGAWHGAWCWHKLIPLLEARGARVIAPDLPGLGADRTSIAAITPQSYVDRVCEALEAAEEPVQLVGHSMGGVVITLAAERMPEKISRLVYLCALLLPNGQIMMDALQGGARDGLASRLSFSADRSSLAIDRDALQEFFYADCSAADLALARSLLIP